MAKGPRTHRLLGPFRKGSKCSRKDRRYLEGDLKLVDFDVLGLSISSDNNIVEDLLYEDYSDRASVCSFSTNATMDNNIGPGRMLDKLYQYLGRKIEWGILRISISTLHPNRILNCLWVIDNNDEHVGGSLSNILNYCHQRRGPATIAGLKSLVHQTQ